MDKKRVKEIAIQAMQSGITPGAMCRAAIYLTLAEVADTENMSVLYRELAKRVNDNPVVSQGMRDA